MGLRIQYIHSSVDEQTLKPWHEGTALADV